MPNTLKFTNQEKTIHAEFQKLQPGVIIYPMRSGNEDIINEAQYSIHNIHHDRFWLRIADLSVLTFLRMYRLSLVKYS